MKFILCIMCTEYNSVLYLPRTYLCPIYWYVHFHADYFIALVCCDIFCYSFLFFFYRCTGCFLLLHSHRISCICCHVIYFIVINFCKIALFTCILTCRGCMCDAVVRLEMSFSINDRNNRVCVCVCVGKYDTWAQKSKIAVGFQADWYIVASWLC